MRKLDETSVLELLPENLRRDTDIIAAAGALDSGVYDLVDEARRLNFFKYLQELDGDKLDHIAYRFRVPFYDRSYDLQTKRQLILNAGYVNSIKGTGRAVEILVQILFGDGRVEEWFEYGGDPFEFKVITSNTDVTFDRADEFVRAVETVKRLSAHPFSVELEGNEEMPFFHAGMIYQADIHEIQEVE